MHRKRNRILAAILIVCVLAAVGYVVYRHTVKDYIDCARMLGKVYNSDSSDLSFQVNLDVSGAKVDSQFRAVRFPFQNTTATQITLNGKNGDYVFYKIHGQNLGDGAEEGSSAIPRNFMELLQWGQEIYKSDLAITRTRDRSRTTYQVTVPDDMVQSFLDAYLGALEPLDLQYSNCRLTLTGSGGKMTELVLQGSADYRVLFMSASATILVRARVNALGKDVQIPTVPDSVVKGA